jgi:hypothetical protein
MDKKRHRLALDINVIEETKEGAVTGCKVEYEGNPMIIGSVLGSLMLERPEFRKTIHMAVITFLDHEIDNVKDELTDFLADMKLKEKNDTVN